MNSEFDPERVREHTYAVERASNAIRTVMRNKIAETPDMHPLSLARNIGLSLLKGSSAFLDIGLEGKDARGCVAEVLLEEIANMWIKDYHIPGTVISNVMLKVFPRTPEKQDTTQLDTLILTDRALLVCECKSYAGDKTTDGEQIIASGRRVIKPWKQNNGHIVALRNNLTHLFPSIQLPMIYNIVYVFAEGRFTEWKQPDEMTDILLVNYGCISKLNQLYNNAPSTRLQQSEMNQIADFCRSTIPSVEEQAEHILRLNHII